MHAAGVPSRRRLRVPAAVALAAAAVVGACSGGEGTGPAAPGLDLGARRVAATERYLAALENDGIDAAIEQRCPPWQDELRRQLPPGLDDPVLEDLVTLGEFGLGPVQQNPLYPELYPVAFAAGGVLDGSLFSVTMVVTFEDGEEAPCVMSPNYAFGEEVVADTQADRLDPPVVVDADPAVVRDAPEVVGPTGLTAREIDVSDVDELQRARLFEASSFAEIVQYVADRQPIYGETAGDRGFVVRRGRYADFGFQVASICPCNEMAVVRSDAGVLLIDYESAGSLVDPVADLPDILERIETIGFTPRATT